MERIAEDHRFPDECMSYSVHRSISGTKREKEGSLCTMFQLDLSIKADIAVQSSRSAH